MGRRPARAEVTADMFDALARDVGTMYGVQIAILAALEAILRDDAAGKQTALEDVEQARAYLMARVDQVTAEPAEEPVAPLTPKAEG